MFNWLRKKVCKHEFNIKDITLTGIKELEYTGKDFNYEWYVTYHSKIYEHKSVTHYTYCHCRKCFGHFYSNGGLQLPGKLIREKE